MTISNDYIRKQAEEIDRELNGPKEVKVLKEETIGNTEEKIIKKEIKAIVEPIKEDKAKNKILFLIIALFLIGLLVLMVVPNYLVKLDPRPSHIPGTEIIPTNVIKMGETGNWTGKGTYAGLTEANQQTKMTADRIASTACSRTAGNPENRVCYAKAMFGFVKKNMMYINDPRDEYLKNPIEAMNTMSGDCDDHSILLASLLKSVGITTRLNFIPNHVYVSAYIPEALNRYKDEDGWVNMDATCKSCEFGEMAPQYAKYSTTNPEDPNYGKKRYLYI